MVIASKRVLVVDDEKVVCKSFERVLTEAGFDVAEAHNGNEALEQLQNGHFDVALTDLKMPGLDGMGFLRRLKEMNPEVSVVVITGFPSHDSLREAADLGVVDYLTKPISPETLTRAAAGAITARSLMETGKWPSWAKEPEAAPAAVAPEPVQAVTAAEPIDAVELPAPEIDVQPAPSFAKAALALATAPFISLAYVMFLPLLGFAMLAAVLGKKIATTFAGQEA